jgi:acyl transferase domain-containing protein
VSAATEKSVAGWAATALRAPRRTVYSAYLGTVLPPGDACDPGFWARQPASPVLFHTTLDRMLGDGDFLLLEAGPGQGLSALARRHPAVISGRSEVVPMLPAGPGSAQDDRRAVAAAKQRVQAQTRRERQP